MIDTKLGLVGAGNMARALVRGLLESKTLSRANVRAFDVQAKRRAALTADYGVETCEHNAELVTWADTLILAVKPQSMDTVLSELGSSAQMPLVISIAAGVPTARIEAGLPSNARVIRAMPNTAAMALAGATGIATGARATLMDLQLAETLFQAVGRTVVIDEACMDAVTGLSGSGPAYVMLMIEALTDGGVLAGLPRDVAHTLAAQTVFGSAKLLLETGEHPAKVKDMVTSPGGTTIAGLKALEHGGFRHCLMRAVELATRRATELGLRDKPQK